MTLTPEMLDAMLANGLTREDIAAEIKRHLLADQKAAYLALRTGEPTKPTPHIRPNVRQAVIARDGFVCVYCGTEVLVPHLDHVMPWSRGGLSIAENLVVSCLSCNAAKKDRTPEEWRSRQWP